MYEPEEIEQKYSETEKSIRKKREKAKKKLQMNKSYKDTLNQNNSRNYKNGYVSPGSAFHRSFHEQNINGRNVIVMKKAKVNQNKYLSMKRNGQNVKNKFASILKGQDNPVSDIRASENGNSKGYRKSLSIYS